MGPDFLTWFRSRRESLAPSRSCQEMSQRSTTQIPAAPTNTATPAPLPGRPSLRRAATQAEHANQAVSRPSDVKSHHDTTGHNSRSQWIGHSATAGPYIRP